jgi:hypothetical protein
MVFGLKLLSKAAIYIIALSAVEWHGNRPVSSRRFLISPMIRYLTSSECRGRAFLEKLFELARQKFHGELMYEIDEKTVQRNLSPHTLCSAAYDTDSQKVLSYFCWTITDTRFRDGLITGKFKENDLYVYHEDAPPVLFFNTFIVTNSHHAPYIVRNLIKDLHVLICLDNLQIQGALAIGGLRCTERWLLKYGFREVGRYAKFPILWATLVESPVLCGLLRTY